MASKQISSKKGAPPASDACGSKKKNHGKRGKSSSANRKRTGVAIREAGGDQQAASDRRLSKKWTAITDYYRTGAYSLKADGAVTAPGWNGRSQPKQSRAEVKRDYATKAIHVTLSKFFPVWCDLCVNFLMHWLLSDNPTSSLRPTILLDSDDRAFFYRTDQALWLLMRAGELDDAIRKLLWATLSCCKMRAKFAKSERGPHFPCIIGHFRAYCEVPKITDWHAKNEAAVTEFISTPIIKDITKWICRVVQTAFPGVAKRFLESAAWHKDKHHVEPLFGLFWNLCINGMFEGQRRIHCLPHADSKNIVGICVLVIYEIPGKKFNHSKRTWLVLWEAGVIIQLPPWVMAAYPSSLLFHFNVDICDFKFVTTEGEERPTPENSTPLEEGDDEGRGSLVYFNQAAMYQSSETDSLTLKKAVAAGHSGMTDYGADIQAAFEKHGVYKSTQPSTSS
ncbi:hypothetical protein BDZ97DRAFT_1665701 [Flammula alnicola]|nr:hypothetical protein BDZ97DRAFT_1665701 [Flammula alnicola]